MTDELSPNTPKMLRLRQIEETLTLTGTSVIGTEVASHLVKEPGQYTIAQRSIGGTTASWAINYIGVNGIKERAFIWTHFDCGFFASFNRNTFLRATRREAGDLYDLAEELYPYWFPILDDAVSVLLSEVGVLHPRLYNYRQRIVGVVRDWKDQPGKLWGEQFSTPWLIPGIGTAIELSHEERAMEDAADD